MDSTRIYIWIVSVWLLPSVVQGSVTACYVTTWAQYRKGSAQFSLEDVDPHLCTHLFYAFANINDQTLQLAPAEWNDVPTTWDKGNYKRLTNLRKKNPSLKVLLSVGGWKSGPKGFTAVVTSKASRQTFVNNVITFLRRYSFDGIDLDWEYPGIRGSAKEDAEKYCQLLKELRSAFDTDSSRLVGRVGGRRKRRLLLTTALPSTKLILESLPCLQTASSTYADYVITPAYDYHGHWEWFVAHGSPLFAGSDDIGIQSTLNVNWTASVLGPLVGPGRLLLGLPLFAKTHTLEDAEQVTAGSASLGPGEKGTFTGQAGMLAYYEVCQLLKGGWRSFWDRERSVPFAAQGDQWVGYEDTRSLMLKTLLARVRGLAGVALWTLDLDDFNGTCGQGKFPLVNTVKKSFKNFPILKQRPQKRQQPNQRPIPRRRRPRRDVRVENGSPRNETLISGKEVFIKVLQASDVLGNTGGYDTGMAAPDIPQTPEVTEQTVFDRVESFGGNTVNPLAVSVRSKLVDVQALVRYDFQLLDSPISQSSRGENFIQSVVSLAEDFIRLVKKYITGEVKKKVTRGKRSINEHESCTFQSIVADSDDCRYYYQCSDQKLYHFFCGPGAVFDPDLNTCVSPNTLEKCAGVSTAIEEPSNGDGYVCEEDGYYRDSFDCNKFYRCADKIKHFFSCPDGLVFKEDSSSCDFPDPAGDCSALEEAKKGTKKGLTERAKSKNKEEKEGESEGEDTQEGNMYQRLAEPTKGSTVASRVDRTEGVKLEIKVGAGGVGGRMGDLWGRDGRSGHGGNNERRGQRGNTEKETIVWGKEERGSDLWRIEPKGISLWEKEPRRTALTWREGQDDDTVDRGRQKSTEKGPTTVAMKSEPRWRQTSAVEAKKADLKSDFSPEPFEDIDLLQGMFGTETSTSEPFACPRDGYFQDTKDCRKFYHCSNGLPYHVTCIGGLVFNHIKGICDWPQRVPHCSNKDRKPVFAFDLETPTKDQSESVAKESPTFETIHQLPAKVHRQVTSKDARSINLSPRSKKTRHDTTYNRGYQQTTITPANVQLASPRKSADSSLPPVFPGYTPWKLTEPEVNDTVSDATVMTSSARGPSFIECEPPGFRPDPTDCHIFYICSADGTEHRFRCAEELVFNLRKGYCEPPSQVPGCERKPVRRNPSVTQAKRQRHLAPPTGTSATPISTAGPPAGGPLPHLSQHVLHQMARGSDQSDGCASGARRPHPFDCGQFFRCEGGEWRLTTCPPGRVYNTRTAACDSPPAVPACRYVRLRRDVSKGGPPLTLNDRQETVFPGSNYESSLRSTFISASEIIEEGSRCDPMVEHLLPDVDNCAYYFKCVKGTFLRMRCKRGLAFHSKLKICDWAESVPSCKGVASDWGPLQTMDDEKLGKGPSETEGVGDNGEGTLERAQDDRVNEEGVGWTQDQVISSSMAHRTGFQCPYNGLFSHPYDCSLMYECAGSSQRILKCPNGLVFDSRQGTCNHIQKVPECFTYQIEAPQFQALPMMYGFNSRYNSQYSSMGASSDNLMFPTGGDVIKGEEVGSYNEAGLVDGKRGGEGPQGYDSGFNSYPTTESPMESTQLNRDVIARESSLFAENSFGEDQQNRQDISSTLSMETSKHLNTGNKMWPNKVTDVTSEGRKIPESNSRSEEPKPSLDIETMEFYEPKENDMKPENYMKPEKAEEIIVPAIGMIPGRHSIKEDTVVNTKDVWSEDGQLLSGPSKNVKTSGQFSNRNPDEIAEKVQGSPGEAVTFYGNPSDPKLPSFRHHVYGDVGTSNEETVTSYAFPEAKEQLNLDPENTMTERQLFKTLTSSIVEEQNKQEQDAKEAPWSEERSKEQESTTKLVKDVPPPLFTCSRSGLFADPEDCQRFFKCSDELIVVHLTCPDLLVYNEHTGFCDQPINVPECYDGNLDYDVTADHVTLQQSHDQQNDLKVDHEPLVVNGIDEKEPDFGGSSCEPGRPIPDPNDCSRYYQCVTGGLQITYCPKGLLFNKQDRYCDLPTNVPTCLVPEDSSTDKRAFEEPANDVKVGPHGAIEGKQLSMDYTTLPPRPTRPGVRCEGSGYVRDEHDCSMFYYCSGPILYEFQCAAGLAFDPEQLLCEWPNKVPGCEKGPRMNG